MGGYAYGSVAKRKLLEKEGIKFQKGSVKDFATCRIALKNGK
jgi:hypothetical protein